MLSHIKTKGWDSTQVVRVSKLNLKEAVTHGLGTEPELLERWARFLAELKLQCLAGWDQAGGPLHVFHSSQAGEELKKLMQFAEPTEPTFYEIIDGGHRSLLSRTRTVLSLCVA
jgi:hypothetical protein